MTRLSVNVNKIAWLRNARGGSKPDLVASCATILHAGAHGITVHPRPDQRHIVPDDVTRIHEFLSDQPDIEFNIEGNPNSAKAENGYPGFTTLIETTRPDQCTLVPDSEDQLTSDHGWDLTDDHTFQSAAAHVRRYQDCGVRTSLFLDPDLAQVERANELGADRIELYTGPWVDAIEDFGLNSDIANERLAAYKAAADRAIQLGLGVNAGHDLNQSNVGKFCAIADIAEVSIGHALVSDALDDGLSTTVKKYLAALDR
ncbi:MAG: pyridoxine 5'-phosphate synthase [Gammaproteobacteria bacterium]|nr:pyridoxine 5'-phosphate synthase [Gammaproteobacteria bacterium]